MDDQTETRKMKLPSLTRSEQSNMDIAAEERTLEFAFSSETAVERWFGDEVLSHDAGSADLSRLNDAAPLLWNHNRDEMIGVVEKAWMGSDKRGYAKVRFGTSARAEEILADVNAGIIRNVSFGYRINEMSEAKRDDKQVFTATSWSPLEISLVSIPADNSVGLGRSETEETRDVVIRGIALKEEVIKMENPAPAQPVDVRRCAPRLQAQSALALKPSTRLVRVSKTLISPASWSKVAARSKTHARLSSRHLAQSRFRSTPANLEAWI